MDIKSAFRLLPVSPEDFELLGIQFDKYYYIDKCLPMGCALSCKLFETFSTFIQWVVERRASSKYLDHFLDDIIFMGAENTNDCANLMDTFTEVCSEIGIPVAENKTLGLTVLPFLGYVIDTKLMMILIPMEKIIKLKSKSEPLLLRRKVTLKDLESVTGLMSFCSRAIPSARAFLRRFYDLMLHVKRPFHRIRRTLEIKADISMWLNFLDDFNGNCFFPEIMWTSNEALSLFTDSSGNPDLGCGVFFQGSWAQFKWPESWKHAVHLLNNISFLELVPVVLAMFLWAAHFKNKKILFHIDNMALVSIVNKRSSKDKFIMTLIRPFVLPTMVNNIQFKAVHIEGARNEVADAISRFQMSRFRSLVPAANMFPAEIPEAFLTLILNIQ